MIPPSSQTFRVLFRHSLALHRASRVHWAVSWLMLLTLALATWRGGQAYHRQHVALGAAREAAGAEWAALAPAQWLDAGVRVGRWAFLPARPESALMEGVSRSVLGAERVRVGIEPAHRLELFDGMESWNPHVQRTGGLDLGFLLFVLGPLWAILLSYDTVCGEKSRGTLRLLFSHPVSPGTFLAARWLALALWVSVPVVLGVALGLAASLASGHFPAGPPALGVLALFLALACTYLVGTGAFGLWASARTADPRSALMLLVAGWAAVTFLIPRAAMLMGARHEPGASMAAAVEKRQALTEARRAWAEDNHGRPASSWMEERVLTATAALEREAALDSAHEARRASTLQASAWAARLSPWVVATEAAMTLASTDPGRYAAFEQQADRFRHVFTRHYTHALGAAREDGPGLLSRVPDFAFQERSAREVLSGVLPRLALLVLLGLAAFLAAVRAFRRYDLR